jgi:hypothetical protein
MEPSDAPPSYTAATGSSATTNTQPHSNTLNVPGASSNTGDGIPASARRSMEDENRPLPSGWVRQFDTKEHHQFFVDTNHDPPRSIWHHPYDDEDYLKTLTSEQREQIEAEEMKRGLPQYGEDDGHGNAGEGSSAHPDLPPRPPGSRPQSHQYGLASGQQNGQGKKTFGRKLKDKVTNSTHEERVAQRAREAEEERKYYEAHQRFRLALAKAQRTGEPQLLGKDKDGKNVYIEPPQLPYGSGFGGGGRGYGGGPGGYPGAGYQMGNGGYGVNPYQSGIYGNPNARYIRPMQPYGRPYGGGYGGGYGLPIAGGLLGGALLGGLLF